MCDHELRASTDPCKEGPAVAEALHQSSLTIGGVMPMTWKGTDGTIRRRVVFELRGLLVMNVDGAQAFVAELREAIREASEVE